MLKGARERRRDAWQHTSMLCATMENVVHGVEIIMGGENVKMANPEMYMPTAFRETPAATSKAQAKASWEEAIKNMNALIDRRNIERAKTGLPPLPYKEL